MLEQLQTAHLERLDLQFLKKDELFDWGHLVKCGGVPGQWTGGGLGHLKKGGNRTRSREMGCRT